jgi:hypothetical protein
LFSTGIVQGSGMVVPQVASAQTAAAYLLVLRLITVVSQLSQAPFYSRLPSMAKDNAEGNTASMVVQARRGLGLSLWTMVIGIFGILIVFPMVLRVLDSSVDMPTSSISLLLCLAFFLERYGSMHMQIYTLSNHVIWHRVNGLAGLIVLFATSAMVSVFSIEALPLAMLVGYGLYLCPVTSHKSLKFLGVHRWAFERSTSLGPLLALSIVSTLFAWNSALFHAG